MGKEVRFSVLAYEDGCGIWLKIPEIDAMCCTDELDGGLDALDEDLAARRWAANQQGEELLEILDRTVRWVGKEEFGPTQVDIDRERYEQELLEEEEV